MLGYWRSRGWLSVDTASRSANEARGGKSRALRAARVLHGVAERKGNCCCLLQHVTGQVPDVCRLVERGNNLFLTWTFDFAIDNFSGFHKRLGRCRPRVRSRQLQPVLIVYGHDETSLGCQVEPMKIISFGL